MLRTQIDHNTKWKHLSLKKKLSKLFGPCGAFVHVSWILISPFFLVVLIITHAVGSFKLPVIFSRDVPLMNVFLVWALVYAPLSVVLVGAIVAVLKMRKSGKRLSSLLDSSAWHQEDTDAQRDSSPPSPSCNISPKRENTYIYIDPTSRGATIRSVCQPRVDNYGWRSGRLKEWQEAISLVQSSSQPSFAASLASQNTLTLFGSPPASNGFMLSDALTVRTAVSRANDQENSVKLNATLHSSNRHQVHLETAPRILTRSEPPFKTSGSEMMLSPSSPPSRISPSRSEPPILNTTLPLPSLPRNDHKEIGVNPQRSTVIRRVRSEDSVQAFSTESISVTPIGISRQRSLSSVSIYDNNSKV
ncbi:hypothetical protein DICVIV_02855 [Dictyocaulus viviparus]|uniref:Uncharacterized protein n=1 Tax=Dictyocaulus viviparus TaxID=29172 RepID=A0A0D8Y480_DICVI|nr:hypothetical protein DICVIV_02855 [Dictyocaulus viviparus]